VTITLRVIADSGGWPITSPLSDPSTTTGPSATPYGLPNPPPAANPACSVPWNIVGGQVGFFWSAASANGRPVVGYRVVNAAGTSTVGGTSFSPTYPADGAYTTINVRTLDSTGAMSGPLTVTCQHEWPPTEMVASAGPLATCPSPYQAYQCRWLDIRVAWLPPGSWSTNIAHYDSWEYTLSLNMTSTTGQATTFHTSYWHTWGNAPGEFVQARIPNVRGHTLCSTKADWYAGGAYGYWGYC
jgi:hypothetical protein